MELGRNYPICTHFYFASFTLCLVLTLCACMYVGMHVYMYVSIHVLHTPVCGCGDHRLMLRVFLFNIFTSFGEHFTH